MTDHTEQQIQILTSEIQQLKESLEELRGSFKAIKEEQKETVVGSVFKTTQLSAQSKICPGKAEVGGSSFVGCGVNNTSLGNRSFVGAGQSNTSAGADSSIGAGQRNTTMEESASGVVGGGFRNTTLNKPFGVVPGGAWAKTNHWSELAHAAGAFTHGGDAQHLILVGRKKTLNNNYEVLSLDGQNSDSFWMPLNTTWTYTIKVSAYAVGKMWFDWDAIRYPILKGAGWIFEGAIRRDNGNGPDEPPGVKILPVKNTMYLNGILTSVNRVWKDEEMNATEVEITVKKDQNNNKLENKSGLQILVKGLPNTLIRWTAVVDICQVTWKPPYDIPPCLLSAEYSCHIRDDIGTICGDSKYPENSNEDSNHW